MVSSAKQFFAVAVSTAEKACSTLEKLQAESESLNRGQFPRPRRRIRKTSISGTRRAARTGAGESGLKHDMQTNQRRDRTLHEICGVERRGSMLHWPLPGNHGRGVHGSDEARVYAELCQPVEESGAQI